MPLLLAALVLTGCATKSVESDFAFTPDSETGLLVGSASAGKADSWYAATIKFTYSEAARVSSQERGRKGSIQVLPVDLVTGKAGPTELPDADGTLFAIPLAPGDYVLSGWSIDNGSDAVISPIDPQPLAFTVRKGKATYIGNLHMSLLTGRNIDGIVVIADGQPAITDRSERDIPLLLRRYPKLKREEIEIQVPDDRPWGGAGPPDRIEARLAN